MTEQPPPGDHPPPPPPGGYPPPPPAQGGGYAPPAAGGYDAPQAGTAYPPPATAAPVLPTEAYTPWGTRVLAWLIDAVPLLILEGIGWGLLLGTRQTECITDSSEYNLGQFCATGASTLGQISIAVTGILALVYWIWNLGYRQGTTGSSIGKSIMKFKIINEKTGQPVGFGMSFVRELIYWVAAGLCVGIVWLVAVLFPLWDAKRQTLVDKILNHAALPI
jgi:uncharacterized RDD family membrane protein YckC